MGKVDVPDAGKRPSLMKGGERAERSERRSFASAAAVYRPGVNAASGVRPSGPMLP